MIPAAAALLLASTAEPADPVAGRAVVVGAAASKATPCFSCHGMDGAGDASGAFPRLAGQLAFYQYKQLLDYAAGTRPNEIMAPIARELTEAQMADVATYYAAVEAQRREPSQVDAEVLERGRRIATEGLPDEGVQACVFCHGRALSGLPPLIPYLAGQYAPYTELQLRLWKARIRRNDAVDAMTSIAARLSDADIRAVALYAESLPAPGPGLETRADAAAH